MSPRSVLLFILPIVIAFTLCNSKHVQKRQVLTFENVQMHPSCKNRDYCLEVDDRYPFDVIDKLLEDVTLKSIERKKGHNEDRIGDPNVMKLCDPYRTTRPIYQIRDVNNTVRFVVQTKRFRQRIRLEWCRYNGNITNKMNDLPFDINQLGRSNRVASCEQLYTNYKFLVLSLDGTRLESAMVRENSIPVCCRCSINEV